MEFVIKLKEGDQVCFKYPENGYGIDGKTAARFLQQGSNYTVSAVQIEAFDTWIQLREVVAAIWFNAVLFDRAC